MLYSYSTFRSLVHLWSQFSSKEISERERERERDVNSRSSSPTTRNGDNECDDSSRNDTRTGRSSKCFFSFNPISRRNDERTFKQQFNFQVNGSMYSAVVPQGYTGGMQLNVQVPAAQQVPVAAVVQPTMQTVVVRTNQSVDTCRGCGKNFVRNERDKGSARYYRCRRCQRGGCRLW